MSGADEGFLARWSRRKAAPAAVEPAPAPAQAAVEPAPAPPAAVAGEATAAGAGTAPGAAAGVAPAPKEGAPPTPADALPLPTMDDVTALTRSSDYARFVQPGVQRDVSNAAMKKLFSDPHFNVMDGLDTYIGDYGKPDPIPASMLRLMYQSVSLGLFADEPASEKPAIPPGPAQACPDGPPTAPVAQSSACASSVPDPAPAPCPDDDADLRLQPDDAPGRRGPGPGPGP